MTVAGEPAQPPPPGAVRPVAGGHEHHEEDGADDQGQHQGAGEDDPERHAGSLNPWVIAERVPMAGSAVNRRRRQGWPMMAFPAWSTATQNEAVGHDTALSFWLPSTSACDQVPLLHWRTPPAPSTAAQYEAVGHETPVRPTLSTVPAAGAASMRWAADHAWPFHCRTSPVWSTAVQNEVDGHETPLNEEVLVYGLGIAHCSPFHWEMPPDTETQKVAETQEIDETDPQSPLVPCHDWPSEAKAFPSESTDARVPGGSTAHRTEPGGPLHRGRSATSPGRSS